MAKLKLTVLDMCRMCKIALKPNKFFKKIFEKNEKELLKQLEDLIGQKLKRGKYLPQHICKQCLDDLDNAYRFRVRCLQAQCFFTSEDYKEQVRTSTRNNFSHVTYENHEISDDTESDGIKSKTAETSCNLNDTILLKIEIDENAFEDAKNVNISDADITIDPLTMPTIRCMDDDENSNMSEEKMHSLSLKNVKHQTVFKKNKKIKSSIIKNIARKKKSNSFICDQCGNHFTCRNHFATHLRRHIGDKRFQCELCADKFFTQSELNRHMRRHTGERPYACKHCDRRFTDYSTRVKHERTHTNERPFACPHCSKAFTTTYILKNHLLIHTGQRAFKCTVCDKAFQRQQHLVVHFRSIMHKQNEHKNIKVKGQQSIGD